MEGKIAWIRLLIYFSSSILFIIEIYRLILIFLSLLLIAPLLMAIFQNLILLGFLFGFGMLAIGFYKLFKSNPPSLEIDQYPEAQLKYTMIMSLILSFLIGMLAVLPPLAYVTEDFQITFSIFTSSLWFAFYITLCVWILLFWKLTNEITTLISITQHLRKLTHITLGIIIALFWFVDIFSWNLTNSSFFNYESINLIYIIILVLFLLNQIVLFFNVRKFSYLIYG